MSLFVAFDILPPILKTLKTYDIFSCECDTINTFTHRLDILIYQPLPLIIYYKIIHAVNNRQTDSKNNKTVKESTISSYPQIAFRYIRHVTSWTTFLTLLTQIKTVQNRETYCLLLMFSTSFPFSPLRFVVLLLTNVTNNPSCCSNDWYTGFVEGSGGSPS